MITVFIQSGFSAYPEISHGRSQKLTHYRMGDRIARAPAKETKKPCEIYKVCGSGWRGFLKLQLLSQLGYSKNNAITVTI